MAFARPALTRAVGAAHARGTALLTAPSAWRTLAAAAAAAKPPKEPLTLSSLDDGVTTIVMNNPAKYNGWTKPMMESLHASLAAAAADDATRAVVLTGNGKYYSAGVDLSGTIALTWPRALRTMIYESNKKVLPLLVPRRGGARAHCRRRLSRAGGVRGAGGVPRGGSAAPAPAFQQRGRGGSLRRRVTRPAASPPERSSMYSSTSRSRSSSRSTAPRSARPSRRRRSPTRSSRPPSTRHSTRRSRGSACLRR